MTEPTDVTIHVLRAAPPIRALLIASLGSVLGALFIVVATANGWSVVITVLGVVILVLGLALLGLAVWTMTRMRVRAELTPTGYLFRTPAGVRHGTWAETVRVTASESGQRITLHGRDESVQHVFSPVGAQDPGMLDLIDDLTERLRTSRD